MENFWVGFEKRANFTAAFKGLARKTRVPRTPAQAERVLDYGAMKAAPKPATRTLDYGAMNAERSHARAVKEHDAAKLNYSSGKPVLESKGAPVQTPASHAVPQPPTLDTSAAKRLENATKGSTPLTHWNDALKEGVR
jgi:hypothetical protein